MNRKLFVVLILALVLVDLVIAEDGPVPKKDNKDKYKDKSKIKSRMKTISDEQLAKRALELMEENGGISTEENPLKRAWSNSPTPVKKFTSARVPSPSQNANPYYRAVKIFFTSGGSTYQCSGVVIKPKLVLTAGHCVYDAVEGWSDEYEIIPAYYQGTAPKGKWWANFQWAHGAWTADADVPNAGDFALLETKNYVTGGSSIGTVVGYSTVYSQQLTDQHITALGYPGNHDNGEILHRVDSFTYKPATTDPYYATTRYIGSDMGGGCSGGPWFLDFGQTAVGQNNSFNYKWNGVVGITSFGAAQENLYAYLGSSIIDTTTINKINTWVYH